MQREPSKWGPGMGLVLSGENEKGVSKADIDLTFKE